MIHKNFSLFLKSVAVGASMLIPGASGASMAVVLGIYNDILRAVAGFFGDVRKNALFLLTVSLGVGTGGFLCALPLGNIIKAYPNHTSVLFCALTLGMLPSVIKLDGATFKPRYLFSFIIGVIPAGILSVTGSTAIIGEVSSPLYLIVAGIILAVALILPGVSFSYMLFLFGLYTPAVNAVADMNIRFLTALCGGIIIGTVIFTRLIELLLTKHPIFFSFMIAGFVFSSVCIIFPDALFSLAPTVSVILTLIGIFTAMGIRKAVSR